MSDNRFLSGKTAIAGLGATEFSKNSGRSEIQLGVEAITAALADAGLGVDEVDGLATYTMDNNPEIELFRLIGGKETDCSNCPKPSLLAPMFFKNKSRLASAS